MKEYEALKLAREDGKKIRREHWESHCYLFYKDGEWAHSNRSNATVCLTGKDDWELYVEPIKTFGPDRAMYWLERGFRVKCREWKGRCFFYRKENSISLEYIENYIVVQWFRNDLHLCDENGNYIPEPEEGR